MSVRSNCSFSVILIVITALPHLLPSPPPSAPPNQDLIAELKYELTGKFERLIVGLMRPPAYGDAKEIKDAISVRSRVCACVRLGGVVHGRLQLLQQKFSDPYTHPTHMPCFEAVAQVLLQRAPRSLQMGGGGIDVGVRPTL